MIVDFDERDILEDVESLATDYVTTSGHHPDALFVSHRLYASMLYQINYAQSRPFGTEGFHVLRVHCSYGELEICQTDRYGDDFVFVGRKIDLFPEEGQLDIAEKQLLSQDENGK
jgi:hypothetical protein